MSTTYAAMLGANAYLQTLPSPAFNFGTGDFTISAMVMTTNPGVVVSRKGADESGGGFVLAIRSDGSVVFSTFDATSSFVATSGPTALLDGDCHAVAAIRQGTGLQILVDGKSVTSTSSGTGTPPLNVDNGLALTIGYSQWPGNPVNSYTGMIMNVGIWSSVLAGNAIDKAMFARVAGTDANLQGYWTLNATTDDVSQNDNPAQIIGPVRYASCICCVWASGDQGYEFCQLSNLPTAGDLAEVDDPAPLSMSREVEVPAGAPALFAAIMSGSGAPTFPPGATVTLTDPNGGTYNHDANTDGLYVKTVNGQPWTVTVVNPAVGTWRIAVTAPAASPFALQLCTVPATAVVATIEAALQPLYGSGVTARELDGHELGGWFDVLVDVAVFVVVGAIVVAAVAATGGATTPAIIAAVGGLLEDALPVAALGLALAAVDTTSIATATPQVGGMAGFIPSIGSVLLVDQNIDLETQTMLTYRRRYVYARVDASKFRATKKPPLIGADDTKDKLQQSLSSFSTGYLSICGHGQLNAITGWYVTPPSGTYSEVLTARQYPPALAAGKIVHHAGCNAGYTLGPDLVAKGAVAFFGYNGPYQMVREHAPAFVACDYAIDLALLAGKSCGEAHDAAIAAYNEAIARLEKDEDWPAAATLQQNRDRLVGPRTDAKKYGSLTAVLT